MLPSCDRCNHRAHGDLRCTALFGGFDVEPIRCACIVPDFWDRAMPSFASYRLRQEWAMEPFPYPRRLVDVTLT